MARSLTPPKVHHFAPDPSSLAAAGALAVFGFWQNLGHNDDVLWGECKGSGARPYQAKASLVDLTTSCSCPSRKIPCKHCLALMMLHTENIDMFPKADPPPWVAEWLNKRAERLTRKEEKAQSAEQSPELQAKATAAREKAKAKRASDRIDKLAAAISDIDRWLCDIVAEGIGSLPSRPFKYWAGFAARMNDHSAPGLAREFHIMANIASSGEGWYERLFDRLARLRLITRTFEARERLTPLEFADFMAMAGITPRRPDLINEPATADRWHVIGQITVGTEETDAQLISQRIYLFGQKTRTIAQLIDFAMPNTMFGIQLSTGQAFEGELIPYPSALPLRHIIKEQQPPTPTADARPVGTFSLARLHDEWSGRLAAVPWSETMPAILSGVRIAHRQPTRAAILSCPCGGHLPLSFPPDAVTSLLAATGGHPFDAFGEWDGREFRLLSYALPHDPAFHPALPDTPVGKFYIITRTIA